MKLLA
jgi:serine/threonine protein kinase